MKLSLLVVIIAASWAPGIGVSSAAGAIVEDACDSFLMEAFPDEDVDNLLLVTTRLELKPLSTSDSLNYADIFNNADVRKMGNHLPVSDLQAYRRLEGGVHNLKDAVKIIRKPFRIIFGIYERGNLIGYMTIHKSRQTSNVYEYRKSPKENWVSLSYSFIPSYWKRGIATEAGQRVVRFAFESLGVDGVHAAVWVDNVASKRVLEKIGFKEFSSHWKEWDQYLFENPAKK